jgi:hypothetical protein
MVGLGGFANCNSQSTLRFGWPQTATADSSRDESYSVVADAGYDLRATVGQTVHLDGSRSGNSSGRVLSSLWTLAQKPAGSHASLSNAAVVRPTFVVDVAGDYVFHLTINGAGGDDDQRSTVATVTVSTRQVRPVADAGLNRRAAVGSPIGLDGSRSFDVNGSTISYAWTLIQKPSGSRAALINPGTVRPVLTPDQPGTYVAELVVTDALGLVGPPARVGFSTYDALARRPSAGPAQTIAIGASARVDADGTYLPTGSPVAASWSLIAAPAGSSAKLGVANDARRTLVPDVAGDYVVQMLIGGAGRCDDSDDYDDFRAPSQRDARFATVLISTAGVAPRAVAGPEQKIATGAVVSLDASKSTDVNGVLLTYAWALIAKPAGSAATLDNVNAVRPKFTADVADD